MLYLTVDHLDDGGDPSGSRCEYDAALLEADCEGLLDGGVVR